MGAAEQHGRGLMRLVNTAHSTDGVSDAIIARSFFPLFLMPEAMPPATNRFANVVPDRIACLVTPAPKSGSLT